MKYFITINSNEYAFTKAKFTRKVGSDSQIFEGWFMIAGARFPSKGDTLIVTKEILNIKVVKFQGKVTRIDYLPAYLGQVHIIAYDMVRKMLYLPARALGYASSKGSTIFSNEIGPDTATTDLTTGTVTTTDTSMDTWNFGKSLTGADSALSRNQILDIIQLVSGFDVYIHKNGTADFVNGAGTDRSASITLEDGMNGSLSPDIGYSEDDTRIVKKVIVKGSGVGVKNGNIGVATAGGYVSTDKVRQIEMPYLSSAQTCNAAAANLLTELNKTAIYAKFILLDIISIDYDIFDTIKLKARLPNKIINVNLKIFSIETEVSPNAERYETTTIELANFNRAVTAPLVVSGQPGYAQANNISLSAISTQATDAQLKAATSNQVVAAAYGAAGGTQTVGTSFVSIYTFPTLPNQDVLGVHLWIPVRIVVGSVSGKTGVLFQITDGTNFFPSATAQIEVEYKDAASTESLGGFSIYIPGNVKNQSLAIQAKLPSGASNSITVTVFPTYYTISNL